jgi:hypothetical protein
VQRDVLRAEVGPPTTDQALPEDWPSLAALAMRFGQRQSGLPPSVVLPWYTQFVGQDKRIAGQTGGRMGERFNPFLVLGDPSDAAFEAPGIRLPAELSAERLKTRRDLLKQFEAVDSELLADRDIDLFRFHAETAFSLVGDGKSLEAFALQREPASVRERYGPGRFAQSLLLARRLVEAGASLITVNWDDDSKFDKVSPHWDTHHENFATLKNKLTPMFDRCLSAFLEDLHQRGLLETTLVVATGEFGRTPKIGQFTQNGMTQKTGRDHWPYAFTVLLAGGGVRGGQAYGATDKNGGFVKERPASPADLAATIFHHLGIDHRREYWDEFQQVPRKLATGEPIGGLR